MYEWFRQTSIGKLWFCILWWWVTRKGINPGVLMGDYLVVPPHMTFDKIIHKVPNYIHGDPLDSYETVGVRYKWKE